MKDIDFSSAKLESVKILFNTITEAIFRSTKLSIVIFKKSHSCEGYAQMHQVDFQNASLDHVNFTDIRLVRSSFSHAVLTCCTFSNVELTETSFINTEFNEIRFKNIDLSEVDMNTVKFNLPPSAEQFDHVTLGPNQLVVLLKSGMTEFKNITFSGDFRTIDLSTVQFKYCKFKGDFSNAKFISCNFDYCSLDEASLKDLDFTDVKLDKATMMGGFTLDNPILYEDLNAILEGEITKRNGSGYRPYIFSCTSPLQVNNPTVLSLQCKSPKQ